MGPMGFPRKWEYDHPWDGNGNKTHRNGNCDVGLGKRETSRAIIMYSNIALLSLFPGDI